MSSVWTGQDRLTEGVVAYEPRKSRRLCGVPEGASPPEFLPVTRDYLFYPKVDSGAKPLNALCAGAHEAKLVSAEADKSHSFLIRKETAPLRWSQTNCQKLRKSSRAGGQSSVVNGQ